MTTSIEVFADITCPFAHVGFRRFVGERAARSRVDVQLHVRAWPLEPLNGEPVDGVQVAPKVAALRSSVAPDLFRGFDAAAYPRTSIPALRVVHGAYKRSVAEGERISLLVRNALFEEGRDISDPEVLRDLWPDADAEFHPSEPGPEVADWVEGQRRGVKGSPHYFVHDEDFYCPSLTIEHDGDDLEINFDQAGFDAFVRSAFTVSSRVSE